MGDMDMVALIQNVGFPIATVIALATYVNRINKETREDFKSREKELLEANKQFAIALDKAADSITQSSKTQTALYERMHTVEGKVDDIKDRMDLLIKK